jgi:AcrR family transcriptional regulator
MATDETIERTRNPRGQGARLRGEIITAARQLLENGSAESVTLRSVARAVGITAPSIYTHFMSRDEIMQAIVEEAFEELRGILSVGADLEPAAQLRAVSDAYLRFARERPQRYRLMFGGVWNAADAQRAAAVPPDLSDLGQSPMRVIIGVIQRCVDAGVIDSDSPADDAALLWISLHGYAELKRTSPLFPWPVDVEDQVIRRAVRLRERG